MRGGGLLLSKNRQNLLQEGKGEWTLTATNIVDNDDDRHDVLTNKQRGDGEKMSAGDGAPRTVQRARQETERGLNAGPCFSWLADNVRMQVLCRSRLL
jgi:hypothetical protein